MILVCSETAKLKLIFPWIKHETIACYLVRGLPYMSIFENIFDLDFLKLCVSCLCVWANMFLLEQDKFNC